MALAMATERGRKLKPWERTPWDARAGSLEELAAIPHPSNNHHSNNSETQVDWNATLDEINFLIAYNNFVSALKPLSLEEAKMWKNHWNSIAEFYAAQNTAGSKTLENHIYSVFNKLGVPVNYVANALGYAGRKIGNTVSGAYSAISAPARVGALTPLAVFLAACGFFGSQTTPTPIPTNNPLSSPTAAATATPASENTATPEATATPTQTYKPTPSPTATPTQTSTPTPIPLKYLTNAEKEQLTGYFEKISTGWHQPSVDAANNLLSNESLGPEAWKTFFQGYFSNHAFNENLSIYLGYPTFGWFSDKVHSNLQQGLYGSLTDIINSQTNTYLKSDRSSLTRDSDIVQSVINSHRFINHMIGSQAPWTGKKQAIFDFYRELAEDEELGVMYGNVHLDPDKYPFVGAFRAQAHINFVESLEHNEEIRDQISNTLNLQGPKRDIFKDYGVLVIDNGGLDETQLGVIKSVLGSVPREMYGITNITSYGFFDNEGNKHLQLLGKGINIFGDKVGAKIDAAFPSDFAQWQSDFFGIVLAHEFNHNVDNFYVNGNQSLRERKEALIRQAGSDPQNYLRSMLPAGFFQQAPQEFFASISNQYFASSEHTLELGLERLAQGRTEPINQFLFFADVYSRGGSSTLFYTLDTSGNLARREVQLGRDSQGRINELYLGNTHYQFQLDSIGNAVSVNKSGG